VLLPKKTGQVPAPSKGGKSKSQSQEYWKLFSYYPMVTLPE
jgi:hypothetical protein